MDTARIQFQRDFYHLLLQLASDQVELKDSLAEALVLIAEISDAERAYLEIRNPSGDSIFQSLHIPSEEISELQKAVSTGIISEAIKKREIILVPSALIDPRFQTRESVQRLEIESVLCVPFFGNRTTGVLYLQGDRGFRDQAEKIQLDAELFAQHVSPLLDQLLIEQERTESQVPFESLKQQYDLEGVIGESHALFNVLQSAMMIAPLEVNALLCGETGTGKTQLAKLIHNNSSRRNKPFVEVNCAALPETLVENELFGAVPGGHSSATKPVTGKVATADGGTLFLDEIGELPLTAQASLLQFIQSGNYYPLGSSQMMSADTRLLFATNKNPAQCVKEGSFREDLYHRINAFEIELPTLRQRSADIPLLASHFLQDCCARHRLPALKLSSDVVNHLTEASISGNIRGFQSVIEKSCINASMNGSTEVTRVHLPDLERYAESNRESDFQSATLAFQQKLLEEKLVETNWNVSRTARELNLSRSHVHNLVNSFGLSRN